MIRDDVCRRCCRSVCVVPPPLVEREGRGEPAMCGLEESGTWEQEGTHNTQPSIVFHQLHHSRQVVVDNERQCRRRRGLVDFSIRLVITLAPPSPRMCQLVCFPPAPPPPHAPRTPHVPVGWGWGVGVGVGVGGNVTWLGSMSPLRLAPPGAALHTDCRLNAAQFSLAVYAGS